MRGLVSAAVLASATLAWPLGVRAGAWPQEPRHGLVIVKYEAASADSAYDLSGNRVSIPSRRDDSLSAYGEYGLTRRVTLQAKAVFTRGEDGGFSYSGLGTSELGLRANLFDNRWGVASLYLGGVFSGAGRNAGYAPVGAGRQGAEARLSFGDARDLWGRHVFMETQLAVIDREGLPFERRSDLTVGVQLSPDWQILGQAYAGAAGQAQWVKGEVTALRRLNDQYSLQAGWRFPVAGRFSPFEDGPLIGLWRKF